MIKYHSFALSDEWRTPLDLFQFYDSIYHFDLDACASDSNHLCKNYFTISNSCLDHDWFGNVWINPPYSHIYPFVEKAYNYTGLSCLLLPARTDTKWFHEFILNNCEITFLQGRLRFSDSRKSAPFPSMICIFSEVYNV